MRVLPVTTLPPRSCWRSTSGGSERTGDDAARSGAQLHTDMPEAETCAPPAQAPALGGKPAWTPAWRTRAQLSRANFGGAFCTRARSSSIVSLTVTLPTALKKAFAEAVVMVSLSAFGTASQAANNASWSILAGARARSRTTAHAMKFSLPWFFSALAASNCSFLKYPM